MSAEKQTPEALLPCPFCGGEAEFERMGTSRQSCIVVCGSCGARLESSDEYQRSGSRWNDRAALASAPNDVTPQMIEAGAKAAREYMERTGGNSPAVIYRAMRAAALASAQAQQEPTQRVYLVATGETHEGQETYTRHGDAPPPLCDSECLFAAPPVQQAGPVAWWTPDAAKALYTAGHWYERNITWGDVHELGRQVLAVAQQPAPSPREQRLAEAMARMDRMGPMPGMISAFEMRFGQKWTDPEWRQDASVWASAWSAAKSHSVVPFQREPERAGVVPEWNVLLAKELRRLAQLGEDLHRLLEEDGTGGTWSVLRLAADAVFAAAPPAPAVEKREPLTDERIFEIRDAAHRAYRLRSGARGQQAVPSDDPDIWLARAVERAHGITPKEST